MKTVRFISNLLFHISRIVAAFYFFTGMYALLAMVLSSTGNNYLLHKNGESFSIVYPFTKRAFLLGDNSVTYMIFMVLFFMLYGLFTWLLSRVFHAFREEKLFTQGSIIKLTRFYRTNFILPPICFVLAVIFYQQAAGDLLTITLLHLVIGIFAFFMAAIFRQGYLLQQEQDLTI